MGAFVVTIPDVNDKDAMDAFQRMMDEIADAAHREVDEVSCLLGIPMSFAWAIQYLRTRSRWTQELEDQLIQMGKRGEVCPNMMEWPPHSV